MFLLVRLGVNAVFVVLYVAMSSVPPWGLDEVDAIAVVTLVFHLALAGFFFLCCVWRSCRSGRTLPEIWALPFIFSLGVIWLVVTLDRPSAYSLMVYGSSTYLFPSVYAVSSTLICILCYVYSSEANTVLVAPLPPTPYIHHYMDSGSEMARSSSRMEAA